MVWVFVAVVVIWLAVASPAFRKALGFLFAAACILGLLAYGWLERERSMSRREAEAAKKRISPNEVELLDLRMGTSGPFVNLAGRARNNSTRFILTRIELRLYVEDCPVGGSTKCDIVGDAIEEVSADVPPGQVREISKSVYFRDLGPARAGRGWRYNVVSVSGR